MRKAMSPVPPAMSRMRLAGARLHAGDEAILPQPVKAARHQIVHHIIAARDGTEDFADAACLLFGADELFAEIDLFDMRAALAGTFRHCERSEAIHHRDCGLLRHCVPRNDGPMPELPEVETTVRGLAKVLDGRRISASRLAVLICAAPFRKISASG